MQGTNDYFARTLSALFEIQRWALASDCQAGTGLCYSGENECVNMGAAGSQSGVIGFAWLVSGQHHGSVHKGHLPAKLLGTQRQSPS